MAEDKTKELLERLATGIKDTMNGENYKAFLKVQSQFHSYSANNAMLIYLQRPDASRVAGFNGWKKFERNVMRGEKGISILAPSNYKYEASVNKIDPVTKLPVRDPSTGKIQKENVTQEGRRFVKVSVFDVKQTEGKELPTLCHELTGNSVNSDGIIKSIKLISEVPIIEKEIEKGKGYYSRDENIIVVKPGMSLDQTAKTLIHEFAHSKIHNYDTGLDRATKEVQAESVAYVVADHYKVDTSSYTFDYLASWSSNKELPELKKSISIIQKTADDIIQKMEKVMPTLALQNSPVKEYVSENVLLEPTSVSVVVPVVNIRNQIIEMYSKELPAIRHISEKTAHGIDALNTQNGKPLSIKNIKKAYTVAGKNLEADPSDVNTANFDKYKDVVDGVKQAQSLERKAKAQEKALLNPSKSKVLEMAQ